MAYEQVDVLVESTEAIPRPVPSVLVRVYNDTGTLLFGEDVTDTDGRVGFLLAAQAYTFRFYRFGTSFRQPQHFTVLSDPQLPGTTPNQFVIKAGVLERTASPDPRLCRATGLFRDASGAPRKYLDLHFIADFKPAILDGALVMDERRTIRTDGAGIGCIDLVRCACYSVTIESFEDDVRIIRVPDASSVNLPDLLFPVVAAVVQAPITLAVGSTVETTPVVYDSAGVPFSGTARNDVSWQVQDPAIASLDVGVSTLVVTGLSAGSTQINMTRKSNGVVVVPDLGIQGAPIQVTVS